MRVFRTVEFLDLWESGQCRHPLDRALLVLSAASPEMTLESLASWPIGRRNQSLVELYSFCFGPSIHAWTLCVNCGEKLEFEMDARILAGTASGDADLLNEPVTLNGWAFRVPNSRDLAQAVDERDPVAGAVRIAESCFLGTSPCPEWSEEEISTIGEKMAAADPLAEVRLTLHCPVCGRDWEESCDLISFFWAEVEARARQMLMEVHQLASVYGWSEADILSLSESRRAMYMELAGL